MCKKTKRSKPKRATKLQQDGDKRSSNTFSKALLIVGLLSTLMHMVLVYSLFESA